MAHRIRLPHIAILAPLALSAGLPLTACVFEGGLHPAPGPRVVVAEPERGGPPPHAPAHGYRRKHQVASQDVDLVFDSGLGVYVAVGFPGVYFQADHYFRYVDASWQISLRPDSGWTVASKERVPPGLQKMKHANKKKGGPPGPARRRD